MCTHNICSHEEIRKHWYFLVENTIAGVMVLVFWVILVNWFHRCCMMQCIQLLLQLNFTGVWCIFVISMSILSLLI